VRKVNNISCCARAQTAAAAALLAATLNYEQKCVLRAFFEVFSIILPCEEDGEIDGLSAIY